MTYTKQIAKLLTERPCTQAEISEELGLSQGQVRTAIHELTRLNRINRAPVTYVLTNAGADFAQRTPYNTPSQMAKRATQQAKRRVREQEEAMRTQESSSRIVEQAKQSRPVLESIWGGAHA